MRLFRKHLPSLPLCALVQFLHLFLVFGPPFQKCQGTPHLKQTRDIRNTERRILSNNDFQA